MSNFVIIGKKGINRDQILYIEKEKYENEEFGISIQFVTSSLILKFKDERNRDAYFKILTL